MMTSLLGLNVTRNQTPGNQIHLGSWNYPSKLQGQINSVKTASTHVQAWDLWHHVFCKIKVYCGEICFISNETNKKLQIWASHMLIPIRSRTSVFRHTYIPSVITIWNKLAPDLRCIGERATHPSEVIAFKHKLVKSSFVRFNSHYSIDLPCTWSTACGCSACVALRPHWVYARNHFTTCINQ